VKYLLIIVLAIFVLGCTSNKTTKKLNAKSSKEYWAKSKKRINSKDLGTVVKILVKKILDSDLNFKADNIPSVKILKAKTNIPFKIPLLSQENEITRKLSNSGKFSFLASDEEAIVLKKEVKTMNLETSKPSENLKAKEENHKLNTIKADFLMQISLLNGEAKHQYFYNLELFDKEKKTILKFEIFIDKNLNTISLVKDNTSLKKNINDKDIKKVAKIVIKEMLSNKLKVKDIKTPNIKILKEISNRSKEVAPFIIEHYVIRELSDSGKFNFTEGDEEVIILKKQKNKDGKSYYGSYIGKADFSMQETFSIGRSENQYFYDVEFFDKENKLVLKIKVLIDKNLNTVTLVK